MFSTEGHILSNQAHVSNTAVNKDSAVASNGGHMTLFTQSQALFNDSHTPSKIGCAVVHTPIANALTSGHISKAHPNTALIFSARKSAHSLSLGKTCLDNHSYAF